jgi:16S rRNA (uracil1498-N3)-methyltransferase
MTARDRRLFVPELPEGGGNVKLPAETCRHVQVLRLAAGTRVELFDGRAGEAEAVLREVTRKSVRCDAGPRRVLPPAEPALHLILGVPKGDRLEGIVRMLTELGVASLHLALTERTVPRPGDFTARLTRLRRIALQACAQSGQSHATELHAPKHLLELAAGVPAGAHKLVFWEDAVTPLAPAPGARPSEVWAVIGPEGGLAQAEVAALAELGFARVGLGPSLLRVDTAAVVACALLLDRYLRLR